MRVPSVSDAVAEPADSAWANVPAEVVELAPIPIDRQPNAYIRNAWQTRPYGKLGSVEVATARSGDRFLVRLEWADSDEPNIEFPDGAGVFFPGSESDDPPSFLGTHTSPVRLWAWRDRLAVQQALPSAKELIATGPGVFQPATDNAQGAGAASATAGVTASSSLKDGRWTVVLSGDAATANAAGRMGVVVWDGSNEERAGIGSVTSEWLPLVVE